jgi:hypothetical protein
MGISSIFTARVNTLIISGWQSLILGADIDVNG